MHNQPYFWIIRTSLVLLLFIGISSRAIAQQTLAYGELNEILELYADGQYEVVKAKLCNIGFVVTKSTPDYSLNGVTHRGDFVMMREQESIVPERRAVGMKDNSRFFFSTINKPADYDSFTARREIEVSFDFAEAGATYVYNDYLNFWKQYADTTYNRCSDGYKCIAFAQRKEIKVHNSIQDLGIQDAIESTVLYLEVTKPTESAPAPREHLNGLFKRSFMYIKKVPAVPKQGSANKAKKRPVVRK